MDGDRKKKYFIGLFGILRLTIENNDSFIYEMVLENRKVVANNKVMKMYKKEHSSGNFIENDDCQIERNVVKQLNEDGSRWEGDWNNQQPFGFGSVYDGEGNRIYSGFMFEGKKIGFGTEFFSDNHKVDYCGNFFNDLRHGWGITYDRNGNKLYEGNWVSGKNDSEKTIVLQKNEDCLKLHDMIRELIVEKNFMSEWKGNLVIENYPNVEKIVVKKNSLQNLNSLKICNCDKLKTIETENGAFYNVNNVIIESIWLFDFVIYIFLIYNHLLQE